MTLAMPQGHTVSSLECPPRPDPEACVPALRPRTSRDPHEGVELADQAAGTGANLVGEIILERCVELLADAFTTISPAYMSRVERIARLAEQLAVRLQLEQPEMLARLVLISQLGILSLPESIVLRMHRGELLTSSEREVLRDAPNLGERLLAQLPGQGRASEIVRLHDVHAVPLGAMPVEAEVLRVAIGYDRLEAGGKTPHEAIGILRSRAPMYSESVIDVLEQHLAATRPVETERSVPVTELQTGMILTADVVGQDGLLILGAGHQINAGNIERLLALHSKHVIDHIAWVRGPVAE